MEATSFEILEHGANRISMVAGSSNNWSHTDRCREHFSKVYGLCRFEKGRLYPCEAGAHPKFRNPTNQIPILNSRQALAAAKREFLGGRRGIHVLYRPKIGSGLPEAIQRHTWISKKCSMGEVPTGGQT